MKKNTNWHDYIIQETSRFFHEKGMEPCVSFQNGEIDFEMPDGWKQEELNDLMTELREHLQNKVAAVTG